MINTQKVKVFYKIKDISEQLDGTIFLYMKNSQQVRDLLNSEKMGAATVKKQVGTSEVLSAKNIDKPDIDTFEESQEVSQETMNLFKKCFMGQCYKEEAIYAAKKSEENKIRLIEYAQTILRLINVSGKIEDNYKWEFNIDIGYLYGLIPEETIKKIDINTGKKTDKIDISKINTNNIDILVEPITKSTEKVIEGLENNAEYVNPSSMIDLSNLIIHKTEEFVNAYVEKRQTQDPSSPSAESYLEWLDTKNSSKKFSNLEEEQYLDQTADDYETDQALYEKKDEMSEQSKKITYKLEGYNIRIGSRNMLLADIIVNINGEEVGGTIDLEKMTISDLITKSGYAVIMQDAIKEIRQYMGSAPYAGSLMFEQSNFIEGSLPEVDKESVFSRIYSIDTNMLVMSNE